MTERSLQLPRDLLLILVSSLLVRGLVLWLLPEKAISYDLEAWALVVEDLSRSRNPYSLGVLNWPPAWMLILFVLGKVSTSTGVNLLITIRLFLIMIETSALVVAYASVKRYFPDSPARGILLWGWALNPIAIIQVCQHANFDVLVGLCALLTVVFILRYTISHEPHDWLLGCLSLGAGILVKTVPGALFPLLLVRPFRRPWKQWILGLTLAVGPVALGMAVLYVLNKQAVTEYVLGYRSMPRLFGVTGAFFILHHSTDWVPIYISLFPVWFSLSLGVAAIAVARLRRPPPLFLFLLGAVILTTVVALGPGQGPQYVFWFLPLLVVCYSGSDRGLRLATLLLLAVGMCTYLGEYALYKPLGMFLNHGRLAHSELIRKAVEWLSFQRRLIIVRIPLFLAYLVFLAVALRSLIRLARQPGRADLSAEKLSSLS